MKHWSKIKNLYTGTAKETLGFKNPLRKDWMTKKYVETDRGEEENQKKDNDKQNKEEEGRTAGEIQWKRKGNKEKCTKG